jgi:site-specific DNA-methyltransferase (adenine-specific)
VLFDGLVLDGRNRLAACKIAGVAPRFTQWQGEGSPVEWVVSQNLFRRHLTSSQRAVVAHDLLPMLEAEAKQRQRLSKGRGQKVAKKLDTISPCGRASKIAAKIAKTNSAYVLAVKAISAAAPELIDQIRAGRLKVPEATQLARLSKQQRARVLRMVDDDHRTLTGLIRRVELEATRRTNGQATGIRRSSSTQTVIQGDCLQVLTNQLPAKSVNVVVTSIPYNLGIKYRTYQDNLPTAKYLAWLSTVFEAVKRVLRDDGSFFLNVGSSRSKPWTSMQVAEMAGRSFALQNEIVWVKSITVEGDSYGHFTPLNGNRFLNHNFESIFHFTKSGNVPLKRLAVGVEYADKSNLLRNKAAGDARCAGDVWFVPHETIQDKSSKADHPAVFPVEIPSRCIQLHGIGKQTVVLDPFCGVGTTLAACQALGVRGIGIEIDARYCKEARRHLDRTIERRAT